MRLVRVQYGQEIFLGVQRDEDIILVRRAYRAFLRSNGIEHADRHVEAIIPDSVAEFLRLGSASGAAVADAVAFVNTICTDTDVDEDDVVVSANAVRFKQPLGRSGRVFGVGRNYAAHVKEAGVAQEKSPRIFLKLTSTLADPVSSIKPPDSVTELDFENELGVVIGRTCCGVKEPEAFEYVYGYTICNDVTSRDVQHGGGVTQSSFGKSMDGFCPCGPAVVSADELESPPCRDIKTWLNGELMQHGNTKDMLFGIDQIIAHLSSYCTLLPGDLILTGTPAGVGAFRDPPRFLSHGDALRLEIEGVGVIDNRVA